MCQTRDAFHDVAEETESFESEQNLFDLLPASEFESSEARNARVGRENATEKAWNHDARERSRSERVARGRRDQARVHGRGGRAASRRETKEIEIEEGEEFLGRENHFLDGLAEDERRRSARQESHTQQIHNFDDDELDNALSYASMVGSQLLFAFNFLFHPMNRFHYSVVTGPYKENSSTPSNPDPPSPTEGAQPTTDPLAITNT